MDVQQCDPNLKTMKMLVIGPSILFRTVERAICGLGCNIELVRIGESVREELTCEKYDLLVVNMQQPEIGDILRELRQGTDSWKTPYNIPIVINVDDEYMAEHGEELLKLHIDLSRSAALCTSTDKIERQRAIAKAIKLSEGIENIPV